MNANPGGACAKILAEHCAKAGTGSIVQGRVVVPLDDDDGVYSDCLSRMIAEQYNYKTNVIFETKTGNIHFTPVNNLKK